MRDILQKEGKILTEYCLMVIVSEGTLPLGVNRGIE
jgi:hypothetical protein